MKNKTRQLSLGKLKIAKLDEILKLKGGTVIGNTGRSRGQDVCGTDNTQCD